MVHLIICVDMHLYRIELFYLEWERTFCLRFVFVSHGDLCLVEVVKGRLDQQSGSSQLRRSEFSTLVVLLVLRHL